MNTTVPNESSDDNLFRRRPLSKVSKERLIAEKFIAFMGDHVMEVTRKVIDPITLALYEDEKRPVPGLYINSFPQTYTAPVIQAELVQVIFNSHVLDQHLFELIKDSDDRFRFAKRLITQKIIS